jgi:hypothetical protein
MAKNKAPSTSDATKDRLVTKGNAMSCCHYALDRMSRNFCGTAEYEVPVPEGSTPAQVAEALGGTLVATAIKTNARGIAVRICVVRISVGLLTTGFVQESAVAAGAVVEQVCTMPVTGQAVSKVVAKVLSKAPGAKDFAEVATAGQKTSVIIGETMVKTGGEAVASKVSIEFNVIFETIQLLNMIRQEFNILDQEQINANNSEFDRSPCCKVFMKAYEQAFKKAPEVFHAHSIKTTDPREHHYAQKNSRRN